MDRIREFNLKKILGLYMIIFLLLLITIYCGNKNIMVILNMLTYIITLFLIVIQKKGGYQFIILFYLSFYVFILSRPSIVTLKGMNWPYFSTYTVSVSQMIIFLTIVSLYLGFYISSNKKCENCIEQSKCKFYDEQLKKIIKYLLLLTMCCSFINELFILISNYGHYTNVYLGLNNGIPIIKNIAEFNTYIFIFYLTMNISKKEVLCSFLLFLICGIPGLILGARNAIIIKFIFCFSYFLLRQCSYNEIWFKKRIKIICIILLPIMICSMSIINYTREGNKAESISPVYLTLDFLYKQGTSYDTLCETIEYRNELRDNYYINYTFGQGVDFILRNKISSKILGLQPLENGNGIVNATQSNNLAHRVSYISLGDNYLEGHGRGTTYMSEIYLDFGYLGIIIFNYLIGAFFSRIIDIYKSNFLLRFVCLLGMMYLFILPRFAFFSVFSYLISYYFWLFVLFIIIYNSILRKEE